MLLPFSALAKNRKIIQAKMGKVAVYSEGINKDKKIAIIFSSWIISKPQNMGRL